MADVAVLGCGRMGRGIAQAYALAGEPVLLIDAKPRDPAAYERLAQETRDEIAGDLRFLASIGVGNEAGAERAAARVTIVPRDEGERRIGAATIIYEGVPETMTAKADIFGWACAHVAPEAVIASTSSTMAVDDLAALGTQAERFVNAHWLNPATLMPLVEVARGTHSGAAAVDALCASLRSIGKTPVVMKNSPGYIVPRIQALAMNEAARLAEEGVADPQEIDRAVRLGFGIRYAVLGLLEFIDFGGNDILFHASNHLADTVDAQRYAPPRSVVDNMQAGRNGMRDGAGFLDWEGVDTAAYRADRLRSFVALLGFLKLLPKAADHG